MTQPPPPVDQPPPGGPRLPPPQTQLPPPGYQPAPPGPPTPPPGFQPPPPGAFPPGGPQPASKKGRGCLIAALVVGAIAVLGIIAIIAISAFAVNSFDDAIQEAEQNSIERDDAPSDAGSPIDQGDGPAGGEEANDVGPCAVVDAETIVLDVTNNSSKQSSYVIDVNFLDAAGQRLSDEPFFVKDLRPGEHAVEQSYAFSLEGASQCEIAEVERIASESPDDVSEVTCTITGVDFADDVTTDLVATNGSGGLSDYSIDFAVTRGGVRVGTGFATIENVRAGESAPGEGFSFAPGPAEGATCDVVSVSRTAS